MNEMLFNVYSFFQNALEKHYLKPASSSSVLGIFFVRQQQFCDYTSSNYLSITNLPHEVTSYARDTDRCLPISPCWNNTANISHDK
jgi:hypothetical protein